MFRSQNANTNLIIAVCGVACISSGIRHHDYLAGLAGLACVVAIIYRLVRRRRQPAAAHEPARPAPSNVSPPAPQQERKPRSKAKTKNKPPRNTDEFVDQMIRQGRYALLMRREVAKKLSPQQLDEALSIIEEEMVAVTDGTVRLCPADKTEVAQDKTLNACAEVQPFMIDRCAVTNAEFQQFVEAGGYENDELWDPEAADWRAQFVDQDRQPGPKYFENGQCPPGKENHPVVGVSWYESKAYARWVGKRLPDDPEWIKAASCPGGKSMASTKQPRYPWGNSIDESRANLWWTGVSETVDVTAYPEGDTPNGARQMIGNVWEWTGDEFGTWCDQKGWVKNQDAKSVRGGAFDTYLESQATCVYGSGDRAAVRKHNIGFRCVLDSADMIATADVSTAS